MSLITGVFLLLLIFPVSKGIVPGWRSVQSDFPNYYVSARLATEGRGGDSLYFNSWFQQEIYRYGMEEQGKFSPFPPPTAFVMLPVAGFDPLTAKRIWMIINVLLSVLGVFLLGRIAGISRLQAGILFLLTGIGLVNNLLLGQFYILLLVCLLGGYFFIRKGWPAGSGLLFGTGIAIKYFPVVVLPTLLFEKKYKTIWWTLAVIAVLNLVAVLVFGMQVYVRFFENVFFAHLDGRLEGQSAWAPAFQSWNALGHRLFLKDAIENPEPWIHSPVLFFFLKYGIILGVLLLTASTFKKIRKHPLFTEASLALVSMTAILLSPAGATYHGLLLLFPAALMGQVFAEEEKYLSWIPWIVFLALIGYLPPLISKITVSTGNNLLLFPRLWLQLGLYIVTVVQVSRMGKKWR